MLDRRENEELRRLLEDCSLPLRALFRELLPLMENGTPYGWMMFSYHDIAAMINRPVGEVYDCMQRLREKGILRHPSMNVHYSPWVVRSLTIHVKGK